MNPELIAYKVVPSCVNWLVGEFMGILSVFIMHRLYWYTWLGTVYQFTTRIQIMTVLHQLSLFN